MKAMRPKTRVVARFIVDYELVVKPTPEGWSRASRTSPPIAIRFWHSVVKVPYA